MKILAISSIFSSYVYSQSTETITIARTINRDAASDILPVFLGATDYVLIRSHGCWCAKLANPFQPNLGGPKVVDELDQICKEWAAAGTCLHAQGGSCHQYKGSHFLEMNITKNAENKVVDYDCEGIVNGDECLQDMCKIHGHFSSEIYDFLEDNDGHEAISTDQQFCENGVKIEMQKWCVGEAPHVYLVNEDPGVVVDTTELKKITLISF